MVVVNSMSKVLVSGKDSEGRGAGHFCVELAAGNIPTRPECPFFTDKFELAPIIQVLTTPAEQRYL